MAKLFELPRYIAVEGPIRVGKSTLARVLGDRLAAQRAMQAMMKMVKLDIGVLQKAFDGS